MAEFASKGVGTAALTTGIIGSVGALASGVLGGGCGNGILNWGGNNCCEKQLSALESALAQERAERFTEQQTIQSQREMYTLFRAEDAMYVLDDDLKDAAYYVDAAKKAKENGMEDCARMYAMKAKRRVSEDYDQSKDVLMKVQQKMAGSGMQTAPESIEGKLWKESMRRYDSWAERMKSDIKDMGY